MRSSFEALKYATRRLYKTPGFTLLCVLTITLVVGVNTAVFSVVDALLLRPLPYRDPQQLVNLWETIRHDGRGGIAFPNFLDLQRDSRAFEGTRGLEFHRSGRQRRRACRPFAG